MERKMEFAQLGVCTDLIGHELRIHDASNPVGRLANITAKEDRKTIFNELESGNKSIKY
jgi:hypothetical protein